MHRGQARNIHSGEEPGDVASDSDERTRSAMPSSSASADEFLFARAAADHEQPAGPDTAPASRAVAWNST